MTDEELRAVRWRKIAVIFQGAMNSLNPVHTIGDQLAEPIRAHEPDTTAAQARERAAELLDSVGIDPGRSPQLPARAVRRDAAAGADRDGAGLPARS